ncbi:MAG: NUDIX hydrolase [Bacteroidota bacterium]|nr:NUDIX hydrolase [Candidatus Kapabacteria bacterium]MDW8219251.1 NUDIX hydrolase [Bacteroidota bacterium]
MHRQMLLRLLEEYQPTNDDEQRIREVMIQFIHEHHDCFMRELQVGHITASAWVLNATLSKVLLIQHRKLNKWVQIGGHCDGDNDVLRVALREVVEESGIFDIVPFSPEIFDIDIYTVPECRTAEGLEPAHLHYDVRFIVIADDTFPLSHNSEVRDIQWVALEDVSKLTQEQSVLRMVAKTYHAKRHVHLRC